MLGPLLVGGDADGVNLSEQWISLALLRALNFINCTASLRTPYILSSLTEHTVRCGAQLCLAPLCLARRRRRDVTR